MTWPICDFDIAAELDFKNPRVSEDDAKRQQRTVAGLIDKLSGHPGVILADEVGMGKTFVALGVALAAARTDVEGRPVIVMVPPALLDKWPRDFEVFREFVIRRDGTSVRARSASTALDFLRLLDDASDVRAHVIFLKHGAFHVQWIDHWVKFALIRRALRDIRIGARRTALPRFAADLIRAKSSYGDPKLYERLLNVDLDRWKNTINYFYRGNPELQLADDPIPHAVIEVFESRDLPLEELCETLRALPARESKYIDERIAEVRKAINSALKELWPRVLGAVRFHSPLLILDEAHHLKNPATKLASLFADPDASADAGEQGVLAGALSGVFERMLFLTATPFQLGHAELLNVLNRFRGVDWRVFPPGAREEFEAALKRLSAKLDAAQVRTCELDERWRSLTLEDCGGNPTDETWWPALLHNAEQCPERVQVVLRAYRLARQAMKDAEIDLRDFVVRHLRSRKLPDRPTDRRTRRTGSALKKNGHDTRGLTVDGEALLPFLVAARAQAIVAQSRQLNSRAVFSEGLASSYEAFIHTRANAKPAIEDDVVPDPTELDVRLKSYLDKLEKALPSQREYARHPKMAALIERTLELWSCGEKVVVFCHFIATANAIQQHLSAAIDERLWTAAREKSGMGDEETRKVVEAFGKRFGPTEAMRPHLDKAVLQRIEALDASLTDDEIALILDVVARFVRTPLFVVRHFDFTAQSSLELLEVALRATDSSGLTLDQKLVQFLQFIAKRCNSDERSRCLDALDHVQPGTRFRKAAQEDEDASRHVLMPNVRLVNGSTDTAVRQRLMLSFNTPFFPEILIASSVLAEGVDLHLNCRYLIHHDLSWNPSTIEQRTGRVDRIGAKAERVGKSIEIYLPYVDATQDEKQYRVVMDRERWFQALMGEDYRQDEFSTDQLAKRIPLPEAAARELAFDLSIS